MRNPGDLEKELAGFTAGSSNHLLLGPSQLVPA